MRTRSRTVSFTDRVYDGTNLVASFDGTGAYEYLEDNSPGPCFCNHWKVKPLTFTVPWSAPGYTTKYTNYPLVPSVDPMSVVRAKLNTLDWGKLPSSSEFQIIEILAEIDDTISMFALKFWRQLSYGSFTWGVIPFLNDCKALIDTVNGLAKNLANFDYETSDVTSIASEPLWSTNDYYFTSFHGTVRFRKTGFSDISFQNPASIALDRLGLHPDLATAWNLIPFSFVVDYILPIGDFLESF